MNLFQRARAFSGEENPKECHCKHKLQGTGVFFQSSGLIKCAACKGWQEIQKPIE